MRDTSAYCECCKKRESAGQCVKGRVMCPCDKDKKMFLDQTLLCPDCSKCPTHCKCHREKCHCQTRELGHKADCDVRMICKEKIRRADALGELETANLRLKNYGITLNKNRGAGCRAIDIEE